MIQYRYDDGFCNKCGKEEIPLTIVDGMILCNACHLEMTRLVEKWYDDKKPKAKKALQFTQDC